MGISFDTAANIISDAAIELGLVSTPIADPYASPDANILRLCGLLKGLGEDLARDHQWSHLTKGHTFQLISGAAAYNVPADFDRIIHGTARNSTNSKFLLGPLTTQEIQQLANAAYAGDPAFYIYGGILYITPTPEPTTTELATFSYVSSRWVRRNWQPTTDYEADDLVVNDDYTLYTCTTAGTSASSIGPTGVGAGIADGTAEWFGATLVGAVVTNTNYANEEAPTWGGDTVVFDRRLMVLGLKHQFKGDVGFEATKSNSDFAAAYARAKGADSAAPTLSLAGPRSDDYLRYNIPTTGFGA